MRTLLTLAIVLGGCGDNLDMPCEPGPEPELPPAGPLADPSELAMPADCVPGGLEAIAGRWFVRDPAQLFRFHYPSYEATCGAVRPQGVDDDHELGDDRRTVHTWSDGTVLFERTYQRYEITNFVYEYATAEAVCVRPDGTVGGAWAQFQTDFGTQTGALLGTRFANKDDVARGLELVGALGTSSASTQIVGYNLAVADGLAYVTGPLGFEIIDVSDPRKPVAISHLAESWNDVRVVRHDGQTVAYGASFRGNVTVIVDVTTPAAPRVTGTIPTYSHSLQIADHAGTPWLYLGDYTGRVPVYDLANPLTPVFVGAAPVPGDGAVHDLTVDGDRIFVNNTTEGFVAIDTGGGLDTATELGRSPGTYSHASAVGTVGGTRVVLHGDEGMTPSDGGAFLRVLGGDPALPAFMHELGRYQSRPEVGIHNFEVHGDRAYIAYYQDGVRVVDLADPTNPREVAHYNTWDADTAATGGFTGALGIRVVDGLIYVADSERGLLIFRETP